MSYPVLEGQEKVMIHALDWALSKLKGTPEENTPEYKAASDLVILLKQDYDWLSEAQHEIQHLEEELKSA